LRYCHDSFLNRNNGAILITVGGRISRKRWNLGPKKDQNWVWCFSTSNCVQKPK